MQPTQPTSPTQSSESTTTVRVTLPYSPGEDSKHRRPLGPVSVSLDSDGEYSIEGGLGPVSLSLESDGSIGAEIKIPTPAPGLGVIAGAEINLVTGEIESVTGGISLLGAVDVKVTVENCMAITTFSVSTPFGVGFSYSQSHLLPGCKPPLPPPPPPPPPGDLPPLGPNELPPGLPSPSIQECSSNYPNVGWCLFEVEYQVTRTQVFPKSQVNLSLKYGENYNFNGPPMIFTHTEKGKYKVWFKNFAGLKQDIESLDNPTDYTTSLTYTGSVGGRASFYVCAVNRARYRSGYNENPYFSDIVSLGDSPGKYYLSTYTYFISRLRGNAGGNWYPSFNIVSYVDFSDGSSNFVDSYRVDSAGYFPVAPVYQPEDRSYDSEGAVNGYSYAVEESKIKISLIYGDCADIDLPPDDPPPPPPPPPYPPPLPPFMNCCGQIQQVQESNHALMRMVREMHQVLNPKDVLKSSVPRRWLYPDATGQEKISDYPGLFKALFLQNDMNGFQPFIIEIRDTNAAKAGEQPISIKINNLSSALKEILQYLVDTAGDIDSSNNIQVRVAYTTALTQKMLAVYGEKINNIEDFLGYEVQQQTVELPMMFNVLAGTKDGKKKALDGNSEAETEAIMPELLQNTEHPIVITKNVSRKDLSEYLLELLNIGQASNKGRRM